MAGFSVKLVWQALKESFNGFIDDKVPKLSASLAYYTVFSLAPLLILIIFLAGMISLAKQPVPCIRLFLSDIL